MNNNIEETYCSLEVAKLLRNIGFDCFCNKYVINNREFIAHGRNSFTKLRIYIPTQTVVVKWFNINFNICIYVDETNRPIITPIGVLKDKHFGEATYVVDGRTKYCWNNIEDAIEAAILHLLTNFNFKLT